MSKYRTAMGKTIDMAALAAKNEHVRAVGNMKVNARGDVIDDKGRVVKPVTERATEHYSKTVGNRGAQVLNKPINQKPKAPVEKPKVDFSELTEAERELEESLDDDIEIEKIKAEETKKNGR
jgi:hypothetical protein